LYIPSTDYSNLTSFEKQYWDVKRENMDCIIFFKKGKFYELYEADAGKIFF
jgi:DNA mismatch repair protein MSH6